MKEEKLKKLKDERDDKVRLRGLSGIHRPPLLLGGVTPAPKSGSRGGLDGG